MALNRPNDAVVSYESALQFDMQPAVRNKLYANLGQSYVSCGQLAKACSAFEEALADKTYFLSDSAAVDYQRAVAAVAQGTAEVGQEANDMSGLDVIDSDSYQNNGYDDYQDDNYDYQNDGYYDDYYGDEIGYDEYGNPIGYYDENGEWHDEPLGEDRFFNASDAEIEQFAQGNEKAGRKRRNTGLKVGIAIIIVIVLLFGGGIAAYILGLGFPSQDTVATELFKDPESAAKNLFAPDLSEAKATALAGMVAKDSNAIVESVSKSMSESTVYVKASTDEGATVYYKISMVRDLIGWKISNIEFYFNSQN